MSTAYRHPMVLLVVLLLTAGCVTVRNTGPSAEPSKAPPAETVETIEEFWPDGSIRLRRQVIRGEGGSLINHGVYARWYDNGRSEYETVFDHGRKDGRAVCWHMNGEKWFEEFYEQGLKEGVCRTWNDEGQLVKEEQYARGKPHGTWTVWKKGAVKARSCFDHGVPVECAPEELSE